jgi:hypothetical protein
MIYVHIFYSFRRFKCANRLLDKNYRDSLSLDIKYQQLQCTLSHITYFKGYVGTSALSYINGLVAATFLNLVL